MKTVDKSEMVKEGEEIYENLRELLEQLPDNYKILEETIDIEIQKEYYESGKNIMINPANDQPGLLISQLHHPDTTRSERKVVLQKLAAIDSVETFRALEAYSHEPHPGLRDWSVLSLQQSRMLLQSSLLGEQQIFISTGLGGKEDKLRYLLIFPYNPMENPISSFQKKNLKNELSFFLSQYEGILEKVEFSGQYATALVLLPLKAQIPEMISILLSECNQYGNFLSEDVLITNMKKFTRREITEILKKYHPRN